MRNRLLFIMGLLVTLLACSTFQPSPTPPIVESPRKIAFVSERDGNPEVYIMNSDGSEQTCLTNNLAEDTAPVWSPDGEKIAFRSNRDGNNEIYIMNADGSNQIRVTHTTADNYFYNAFTWSSDGKKVAFALDMFTTISISSTIYVINTDGTGLTQLTDAQGRNHSPSWSPDGNLISFVSEDDGNFEVYVMNADGSNQVRLTNNESQDYSQVWSPDSKQIAFTSYQDGSDGEIYVVNADGSDQRRVTDNKEEDYPLAWLPTNELIVLRISRDRDNVAEQHIYSVTIDGFKQAFLAKITSDAPEVVSPDGQQVAFINAKDGDDEIHIVDLRSSTQLRLTDNSVGDYIPAWQP